MTRQEKSEFVLNELVKQCESATRKAILDAYTRGYIDALEEASDIITRDMPSILKPQVG